MIGDALAGDDALWSAVQQRRRDADGAFVYAVETTGIFCRPSCASRPALRKNVRFFDTADAATRAGFRACKRCKPAGDDPRDAAAARFVRACRLIEEGDVTRSQELARAVGVSAYHFLREFKKRVGVTPQGYRRRVLAERAKGAMARAPSITAAIYDAGYGSSSRFYARAAGELGMAPARARAGAAGENVLYVIRRCTLGALLLAWTARGVCDVRFADDDRGAEQALRERFPRASMIREAAAPWVDEVVDAVERPRSLDIPLDIQGTAFQERVWRELRRIPVGSTRTYGEIAAAVGAPRAHRAVAAACASNQVAVVVPCHRVVRGDGRPTGYRWGAARKQALLRRESAL